jgi:Molybdopterin oxidoreductase N-terminal domain
MDGSGVTRGALHGSHWGAFYPLLRDGHVVGIEPFDRDPDPSAILQSIPAADFRWVDCSSFTIQPAGNYSNSECWRSRWTFRHKRYACTHGERRNRYSSLG